MRVVPDSTLSASPAISLLPRCPLQYSIDMGLKKMFKNGDAKPAVRRRKGGRGGDAKEEDTDDEVENCSDKVRLVRAPVVDVRYPLRGCCSSSPRRPSFG